MIIATRTVEIDIPDCPLAPSGPPSPFDGTLIGFGLFLAALSLVAICIAVGMIRYRAHELKPQRLEAENKRRQIELNAQVEMAKYRQTCVTCGTIYEPKVKA